MNPFIPKAAIVSAAACLLLAGCGPADAGTSGTATPSATVLAETAESVLKRTAEKVCPPPKKPGDPDPYQRNFNSWPTQFSFACLAGAGHSTTAVLRWFGTEKEARSAFDVRRKQNAADDFHGYPSAAWEEDSSDLPGGRLEYRIRIWQAGAWLVDVSAFDDTSSLSAPDPREVSEEIYTIGLQMGLFVQ
jgi:hypothetical protein